MKMRPYQRDAVAAVFREWESVRSTLLVQPTGTGKTVCFAEVLRRAFPRRAMVLAHREELIFQAKRKIEGATGWRVDVEMGELRAESSDTCLFGGPQVVVSTIQTQTAGCNGKGRMTRFNPEQFGVLVIDEAHHGTANSYRRVLDYYMQNPALRVLGVTATPDRSDRTALGQIYDTVAKEYALPDAINDGWLVPIEQQMVHVAGLDFSKCRTTAGDLNGKDLAAVMEFEANLHAVVTPTLAIAGASRRAIVFASSVAHAERMAEVFNRHRAGCAKWICGETERDARRDVLKAFAAGDVQIVVNVGVLTEGFDCPDVELIVMARPTKSRSLYTQMAGRAIRPLDEIACLLNDLETPEERRAMIAASRKPSCLIVDFVGNSGKHKLISTLDILGGKASPSAVARALAKMRKAGGAMRVDKAIQAATVELSEEAERAIAKRRAQEKQAALDAEAAQRKNVTATVDWTTQKVNPFELWNIQPVKECARDKERALSDKQSAFLRKQGINPDGIPFGQAKQLLDELFRRLNTNSASLKQAALLKKHGMPVDISRTAATRLIDAIAANHWKAPADPAAIIAAANAEPLAPRRAFSAPVPVPVPVSQPFEPAAPDAGDGDDMPF